MDFRQYGLLLQLSFHTIGISNLLCSLCKWSTHNSSASSPLIIQAYGNVVAAMRKTRAAPYARLSTEKTRQNPTSVCLLIVDNLATVISRTNSADQMKQKKNSQMKIFETQILLVAVGFTLRKDAESDNRFLLEPSNLWTYLAKLYAVRGILTWTDGCPIIPIIRKHCF